MKHTFPCQQKTRTFVTDTFFSHASLCLTKDTSSSTWGSTVAIGQTTCYPYDTSSLYTPYGDRYSAAAAAAAGMDSAARRKNATRETTNTLKAWLYEHRKNPYPTKGEKIMLAIITKMTLTQVSTWFANARRRLKKENKMTWEPRNKPSDVNDDADDDKDSLAGSTVCEDSNNDTCDEANGPSGTEGHHNNNSSSSSNNNGNTGNNGTSGSNNGPSGHRVNGDAQRTSSSSIGQSGSVKSETTNNSGPGSSIASINEPPHQPHLLHPHPLHHPQYSAHLHLSQAASSGPPVPHGQAGHLPFEAHSLSHVLSNSSDKSSSLSIGRLTSPSVPSTAASQHSTSSSSIHGTSSSSSSGVSSQHISSINGHSLAPPPSHLPSHVSIASHLAAAAVHHPCYSSHPIAHSVHSAGHPGHPHGHPHYPNAGHHAFNTHLAGHQGSHHHHSLSSLHPITSCSPSTASSPSTSPSVICTSAATSVISSSPAVGGKEAALGVGGSAFPYNLRWNHQAAEASGATSFMFMWDEMKFI